jgi:hypothetical protein
MNNAPSAAYRYEAGMFSSFSPSGGMCHPPTYAPASSSSVSPMPYTRIRGTLAHLVGFRPPCVI